MWTRLRNELMSRRVARWVSLVVPAIALIELTLHIHQTHDVVPEGDWRAASTLVGKIVKDDDLIVFAPSWVDPIGRMYLGDELMTPKRVGRAEDDRFERAIQVGIRGETDPSIEQWPVLEEHDVGRITVRVYKNPHVLHVRTDLVDRLASASVDEVEGGRSTGCPSILGKVMSGALGYGMAAPARRFACRQGFVGESILPEYPDYVPRRVIYASPAARNDLQIRFANVTLNTTIRGHHGIAVHQERDRNGPDVTISWRVGERVLGSFVHHDGEGWKQFEIDTADLAGQTVELVVDVACSTARPYGFEAVIL
jgi:hypothetical protein